MCFLNLSRHSHYDIIIRAKLLIKIVIYKDGNHFPKEEEALQVCHELEGLRRLRENRHCYKKS